MTMTHFRWLLAAAVLANAAGPLQAQDSIPTPPATEPAAAPAQSRAGRIIGLILEEGTGAPVPGAQVGIAMGGAPVTAGIDGRYTLLNVPPGPVALTVRAIG